jgi:hypothetical protein
MLGVQNIRRFKFVLFILLDVGTILLKFSHKNPIHEIGLNWKKLFCFCQRIYRSFTCIWSWYIFLSVCVNYVESKIALKYKTFYIKILYFLSVAVTLIKTDQKKTWNKQYVEKIKVLLDILNYLLYSNYVFKSHNLFGKTSTYWRKLCESSQHFFHSFWTKKDLNNLKTTCSWFIKSHALA